MEEYPPTMNNEPANPKPNRLKTLVFLKMGLLEFIFVALVLLLIFGTLNYLNILPVSGVFPQLSFLPRQTKSTLLGSPKLGEGGKTFSSLPTPTPTPTLAPYACVDHGGLLYDCFAGSCPADWTSSSYNPNTTCAGTATPICCFYVAPGVPTPTPKR